MRAADLNSIDFDLAGWPTVMETRTWMEPGAGEARYRLLRATRGKIMPGTDIQNHAPAPAFVEPRPHTRYLVMRREDVWFIVFGGEEFGPYKSEREAKLFAIEAAHKLGEKGEESEV
jgi:hypothetical protein